MMKLLICFTLFFFVSSCSIANIETTKEGVLVDVYHYGFDIDRITGILEGEIEVLGCKYKINISEFKKVLNLVEIKNNRYNEFDVRSKVIFGQELYFIDREGFVKESSGGFYFLNKETFEGLLIFSSKC